MNKPVLGSLASCLWALALLACSTSPPPDAPNGTPPGGGQSPDPARACQTVADCVVVETACCDHCNGGKAEAFNKARADEYRPKNCEGTACTRRGCGNAVAVCSNNLCKVEIQPL